MENLPPWRNCETSAGSLYRKKCGVEPQLLRSRQSVGVKAAPAALDKRGLEEGCSFTPRFDESGLIPAIVSDAEGGDVLMFAYMNAEALRLTLATGEAHFWSRSRRALWRKGETSGNRLVITEIRTDCDQDVLWISAKLHGEAVCHTGRRGCFYRRVTKADGESVLEFVASSGDP
jgi:phosphoribosyl-AMP cyclohydrolase